MYKNEIWEIISEFPDYMVSNKGRVKGLDRSYINQFGTITPVKGIIKKQCTSRGHLCTRLRKDGGSKCCYVHRLIAIAFIPNPQRKPYINHKDGNKLNNSIANLEWCTSSENNQHAIDNNLRGYRRGCSHHCAVFSKKQVIEMRKMYADGNRISDISKLYTNGGRCAISSIVKGKSYKM